MKFFELVKKAHCTTRTHRCTRERENCRVVASFGDLCKEREKERARARATLHHPHDLLECGTELFFAIHLEKIYIFLSLAPRERKKKFAVASYVFFFFEKPSSNFLSFSEKEICSSDFFVRGFKIMGYFNMHLSIGMIISILHSNRYELLFKRNGFDALNVGIIDWRVRGFIRVNPRSKRHSENNVIFIVKWKRCRSFDLLLLIMHWLRAKNIIHIWFGNQTAYILSI